jgi:hypothetical protein
MGVAMKRTFPRRFRIPGKSDPVRETHISVHSGNTPRDNLPVGNIQGFHIHNPLNYSIDIGGISPSFNPLIKLPVVIPPRAIDFIFLLSGTNEEDGGSGSFSHIWSAF